MLKVRMFPSPNRIKKLSDGISQVIINYGRYLPEYDIELVDGDSFDVAAIHAGMIQADVGVPIVAQCHGLHWSGDRTGARWEWEANKALSTAKHILEKELRLTPHPEKTKIVFAMWKGVEYLGFRFTDRWCSPKENSIKKFKDAIRRRTRRCQPKKLQTIVDGINPVIRGWGRYFGHGSVKECYRHLDGWIRGRIRCFKAKKRCKRVIMYTLPKHALQQMGLVTLSSLRTR